VHPREIAEKLREFEEICRRHGLPVTLQRKVILESVLQRTDHPTADQIYEAVRDRIPQLSRTTVYRTLETFLDLGVLRRVQYSGMTGRFDKEIRRHHHLICERCGIIIDIDDDGLDRISLSPKKLQGFEVNDFSVHFSGVCSKCRKK
jgi:Fur family transcriptional regulator, peroxide stress response regulator